MNNKKLGTEFEKEVVKRLSKAGYWTHFITPNAGGAQPFDIVAMKDGVSYAIDCKTSTNRRFSILRLEDNQIYAFDKWVKCGGTPPMLFVKYGDFIYCLYYKSLLNGGIIELEFDFYARNIKMEEEINA